MNRAERIAELRSPEWLRGVFTDDTLFAGIGTILDQCNGDEAEAKRLTDKARELGGNPGINDFYFAPLAANTCSGDPRAFIPRSGGKAEIKKRAELLGVGEFEGMVNHKPSTKLGDRRPKRVPLAESTVKRYMAQELKANPGADKRALREKVIDEHAYKGE